MTVHAQTTVTSQKTNCKFTLSRWQAPGTTFKGAPVAKIVTGAWLSKQESSYKRLIFECSTSTVPVLKAAVSGMPCRSDYSECSAQVSMETWEIDVTFVGSVWHQGMGLVARQPSLITGILIFNHGEGIKSPEMMVKLTKWSHFPNNDKRRGEDALRNCYFNGVIISWARKISLSL